MKTITLFTAFIFIFLMISLAQEEAVTQKGSNRTVPEPIIYVPVTAPSTLNDLYTGGGGYKNYFYYGEPSGMYFNIEWENGSAGHIDGTIIEGAFRYNLYHQKMEAIVGGDTFAIAKPCELEWLKIGKRKFVYTTFVRTDYEVANTWFEVLCEGSCELLLRRYIKYRVTDGDDDHSNDQLYKLMEYYTRKGNAVAEKIYVSRKALLETLQDHKSEVSAFIKEEKIKLKDQDDLVKLFSYYNRLNL